MVEGRRICRGKGKDMSITGYYEGDRSELLASYVLSQLGFCVPVPRQFDRFLIDIFVQVFRTENQVHRATSLSCGFQIKSNQEPISIRGDHQREAFFRTGTPFFVAVVDKKHQLLSIYTTIQRLLFAWTPGEVDVDLIFDETSWPLSAISGTHLPLGKPIVKIDIGVLDSDNSEESQAERRKLRIVVLWIMVERLAIACRQDQMPFVPMPKTIRTNEQFEWADLAYHVIYHPDIVMAAAQSLSKTITFYKDHLVQVLATDAFGSLNEETKAFLRELGGNLKAVGAFLHDEFK
jgi:hypothetical protein